MFVIQINQPMIMKSILPIIFFFIVSQSFSQVKGKVLDSNGKPLSFVSVYLENSVTGTTTNDDGFYELSVDKKGSHTIVFQFLGYKTIKKPVSITEFPFELNVRLEEEQVILDMIKISTNDNPANTIIRNAIDAKEKKHKQSL